eukprot:COSAG06_NODE_14175_length_1181_cov_36.060074_2_plen_165_part_00
MLRGNLVNPLTYSGEARAALGIQRCASRRMPPPAWCAEHGYVAECGQLPRALEHFLHRAPSSLHLPLADILQNHVCFDLTKNSVFIDQAPKCIKQRVNLSRAHTRKTTPLAGAASSRFDYQSGVHLSHKITPLPPIENFPTVIGLSIVLSPLARIARARTRNVP